jgi:hypothetical protein
MAYGLIKYIKGYHVHISSFFYSPNKKSNDGCTVSADIVSGGLPNLVILCTRVAL